MLDKNEARAFLATGALPSGWQERLTVEAEVTLMTPCVNCDERKCMGCVMREFDHVCAEDCPFCCDSDPAEDIHADHHENRTAG